MQKYRKWCLTFYPSLFLYSLCIWIIIPTILLIIVAILTLGISQKLPSVIPSSSQLHQFSEQRARLHFANLTQFGPRVANTYSEHRAQEFLLRQIEIINNTRTNKGIRVELDIQTFDALYTNFARLVNIVVRLSNASEPLSEIETKPALLISSHYDSV